MGHQKNLVSESTLGGAGNPTIHEPLLDFIKLDVDTRDLHTVISSLISQWVHHINLNDCELL